MTQSDNVIKLLLIEDSEDKAEQIASDLRNGGIAVQLARVTSESELIEHLLLFRVAQNVVRFLNFLETVF